MYLPSCPVSRLVTTVGGEGERKDYSWLSNSTAQSEGIGTGSIQNQTQRISASFLNGVLTASEISSSANINSEQPCSIEQIVEASEALSQGDNISQASDVLVCGRRFETYRSDGTSSTNTFSWQTDLRSPTFFPFRESAIEYYSN